MRDVTSELSARLVDAGLMPGRTRWLLARAILVFLVTASILQLRAGPGGLSSTLPCLLVLLVAAVALLVPRRTLAGHRRLAALRRGDGDVEVSAGKRAEARAVRDEPAVASALHGRAVPDLTAVVRLDVLTRVRSLLLAIVSFDWTLLGPSYGSGGSGTAGMATWNQDLPADGRLGTLGGQGGGAGRAGGGLGGSSDSSGAAGGSGGGAGPGRFE